jgi:hypothetical protein
MVVPSTLLFRTPPSCDLRLLSQRAAQSSTLRRIRSAPARMETLADEEEDANVSSSSNSATACFKSSLPVVAPPTPRLPLAPPWKHALVASVCGDVAMNVATGHPLEADDVVASLLSHVLSRVWKRRGLRSLLVRLLVASAAHELLLRSTAALEGGAAASLLHHLP